MLVPIDTKLQDVKHGNQIRPMVRKHLTTSEVKHNSPSVSQNKPSDYEVEYDGIFD